MRMIAIAILLTCLAMNHIARANPHREEFILRATVLDVVRLDQWTDPDVRRDVVVIDGAIPLFDLRVRVQSIEPRLRHFATHNIVTFAINSPSQIFGSSRNPKGKTFDFILRRETIDAETRFSALKLRR